MKKVLRFISTLLVIAMISIFSMASAACFNKKIADRLETALGFTEAFAKRVKEVSGRLLE
ncbi:MAG: hypothetical protein Q8882_04840 [Bacillota bacterium]|nr:hypothetical protein [Bacillota bacterium]